MIDFVIKTFFLPLIFNLHQPIGSYLAMQSAENKNNGISVAVKEYYGKILRKTADLKTGACCTTTGIEPRLGTVLKLIHPEVLERFYGCGSPMPNELEGITVLDLGCGSGRDSYMLSKLVGESGRVIGVDMTDEQLEVAIKHIDYHTKAFGYSKPNIEFHKGYIEDLESIGIEDGTIDLVVSNCVINLSPDKESVFSEIFRVLKDGGELYFSDVFSDRRVPKEISQDEVIFGECLGGAIYHEDFRRLLAEFACPDARRVYTSPIPIEDEQIEEKVGMINFDSVTVRAFKLDGLEDKCEDFGQVAYYLGTIPESPHSFKLDDHHLFETGRPMPVCGNTALMISKSRYAKHFKVAGDVTTHYGLFDCAPVNNGSETDSSCC